VGETTGGVAVETGRHKALRNAQRPAADGPLLYCTPTANIYQISTVGDPQLPQCAGCLIGWLPGWLDGWACGWMV